MDTFLQNAQRIFEVARTDSSAEASDFALLVRPDGSLHVVMEAPLNLEAVAQENGAQTAYRVSRSGGGVRVSGRSGGSRCELSCDPEPRRTILPSEFLRDQPLYLMATQPRICAA